MKIELLGGCSEEELNDRVKKVAAAGKLSRFPGNVYEVLDSCDDYEKNLKLIKRIIKMGHKSIIEHDYLVFALCDVSPIIEQTIIGNRLTSFTIKSRREVDFRTVGFYTPEFRDIDGNIHKNNAELKEKYNEYMQSLFNKYGSFVDRGIKTEDARFMLPYCYNSNIIMGLDARELERLIYQLSYGKLSKMNELKELGNCLIEIVKEKIPYLYDSVLELQENTSDLLSEYLEKHSEKPEIEILDEVKLATYTENADEKVLESAIMCNYQCSKEKAKEILKEIENKNPKAREELMKIIMTKNERRELEQVNYQFQIPISLSILTHLTRHRMHSLLTPDFVKMWDLNNYVIPDSIIEINAKNEYVEIFENNKKMYEEFKKQGILEEDLIYFYLGGQMCNVLTTMNARTVQWITRLRCCNKAQWQIREIAKQIAKNVREVSPLIGKWIGTTCATEGVCYEGREYCGKIKNIEVK